MKIKLKKNIVISLIVIVLSIVLCILISYLSCILDYKVMDDSNNENIIGIRKIKNKDELFKKLILERSDIKEVIDNYSNNFSIYKKYSNSIDNLLLNDKAIIEVCFWSNHWSRDFIRYNEAIEIKSIMTIKGVILDNPFYYRYLYFIAVFYKKNDENKYYVYLFLKIAENKINRILKKFHLPEPKPNYDKEIEKKMEEKIIKKLLNKINSN